MATLILQDGTRFEGESFGAPPPATGEVVFVTDMLGYQRCITDPAQRGRILCFTYPLIGNVGVSEADMASARAQAAGVIVQSLCDTPSNWRCARTLADFLAEQGVPGMSGVDTRALTRHLRDAGAQRGRLCGGEPTEADLAALQEELREDLVAQVTCPAPYELPSDGPRVAVLDLGLDASLTAALTANGCAVTVYPASTPAADVLAAGCDGVLFSGGPGDPRAQTPLLETVRALTAAKPALGIGLGYQLMALAAGGAVLRMKHGHHGGQPVRELETGRCEQTAQRCLYNLDPEALPAGARVTHVNLNDGMIAGLAFDSPQVAFGVQFHPGGEGAGIKNVYDAFVDRLTRQDR